jgi:hypothetical protein
LGAFESGAVPVVIYGRIQKKISLETGFEGSDVYSMKFFDLSGRRIFPAMNSAPIKTSVYIIRQPGAGARATTMLHVR